MEEEHCSQSVRRHREVARTWRNFQGNCWKFLWPKPWKGARESREWARVQLRAGSKGQMSHGKDSEDQGRPQVCGLNRWHVKWRSQEIAKPGVCRMGVGSREMSNLTSQAQIVTPVRHPRPSSFISPLSLLPTLIEQHGMVTETNRIQFLALGRSQSARSEAENINKSTDKHRVRAGCDRIQWTREEPLSLNQGLKGFISGRRHSSAYTEGMNASFALRTKGRRMKAAGSVGEKTRRFTRREQNQDTVSGSERPSTEYLKRKV